MASSAKKSEIYVDLVARTAEFKAAMGDATNEMRKFSAQTRAEANEAKASMALLGEEIGVRLPRHLRSFVAELPGVAGAMSSAFNAVAVIGLITVVVEAGKKVYEFAEKAEEAARKNAESNSKFSDSLVKSNAELAVANDKIAEQIAKLEKQPANMLKTALDESKLSAIDLATALDDAINKERELLQSSGANALQRIVFADAGNAPLQAGLNKYQTNQHGEDQRFDQEKAAAKSSEDLADAIKNHDSRRANLTSNYYNNLDSDVALRQEFQGLRNTPVNNMSQAQRNRMDTLVGHFNGSTGDQTQIIAAEQALMGNIGTIGWRQREQADHDTLTNQRGTLTGREEVTRLESEDAKKEMEGFMLAFKESEGNLAASMAGNAPDAGAYGRFQAGSKEREYDFLTAELNSSEAKKNPALMKEIIDKLAELADQLKIQNLENASKVAAGADKGMFDVGQMIGRMIDESIKQSEKDARSASEEAKRLAESLTKLAVQSASVEKAFKDAEIAWLAMKDQDLARTGKISESTAIGVRINSFNDEEIQSQKSRYDTAQAEQSKLKTPAEKQQFERSHPGNHTVDGVGVELRS